MLSRWCKRHSRASMRHPFDELVPMIEQSVEDGTLDLDEREDIESAIAQISSPNPLYNVATSDMQRLHGILPGIGADCSLNDEEARGLSRWLDETTSLRGSWPYDEVNSLVTRALADGVIDDAERKAILGFCREFGGQVVDLLVSTPFDEGW